MGEIVDVRKEKVDFERAWELIRGQERVFIGKGKKVLDLKPDDANKEEILKAAMGRSGNLRAPALTSAGRMFIGYNDAIYDHL